MIEVEKSNIYVSITHAVNYILKINIHLYLFSLKNYQHGLWCTGWSVPPLIKGLRFESWVWRKSCWERHP